MELFYLTLAFFCGLGANLIGLTPLVGYLLAGFILSAFGVQADDGPLLSQLSDLGITLMLFTIGLKLQFKDLWKKEVILVGSLHMLCMVIVMTLSFLFVTLLLPQISAMSQKQALLIGFILSFSSTICALQILQESNAMDSRYGKITISILVLQDIFAVLFLVFSSGQIPSVWALLLPALIFAKPIFNRILSHVGHGELLFVMGILLALSGYYLFEYVNIKGDLGALVVGMLISSHPKHNEMVKSLVNFKDLLLIGFFLSIGLIGFPDWSALGLALLISLFIPIKHTFFYVLFTLFNLRARTSYLSSNLLSNYGEFGLIVAYIGVGLGLMSEQWLTIIGLSVSLSIIITSVFYTQSHKYYYMLSPLLSKYQRAKVLPEDECHYPKDIDILIVGSGRLGSSALTRLNEINPNANAWAIDNSEERVSRMQDKGMNVFLADAEDSDFWQAISEQRIDFILIALPSTEEALIIVDQLKKVHYQGKIIAIAHYEDERQRLQQCGVHAIFNIFQEAGAKLAEDSLSLSNSTLKYSE